MKPNMLLLIACLGREDVGDSEMRNTGATVVKNPRGEQLSLESERRTRRMVLSGNRRKR